MEDNLVDDRSSVPHAMKRLLGSFLLLLVLAASRAHAHHDVQGYYSHGWAAYGPGATPEDACNIGLPMLRAQQIASGTPPANYIASLNSVQSGSCVWNTDGGLVGPYGNVFWHDSNYYPQPPNHAAAMNRGKCSKCPRQIAEGNPINPALGNKYQEETDYAGQGPFPLRFVRYYNSADGDNPTAGLAIGWNHTYNRRLIRDGSNVVAKREDARMLRFTLANGAYVADSTASEKLERITSPSLGWKLTSSDEEVELYDDPGKLLSITNRAGLTQTLGYDANGRLASVSDAFGRTLTFARNSAGQIASMTTPAGVVSYAYGTSTGVNLVSVTYPGPATRTYQYENASWPTRLTGITDENGQRFATFAYDSNGKAISTEHAGGAGKVTIVNDSSSGTRNVSVTRFVDATTSVQRTYTFDSSQALSIKTGVIANAGEPCPSCGPKSQTYDANANLSSVVDWNGNRTNYSYDLARNLETFRTEGLTSAGGSTPQTRTISTEWDSNFRLPTRIAEPLRITTNVYDADGTVCGTRGALCSKTIQATTDASGALGFSATPSGAPRTWGYTYNSNGSVLTADGPRTDVSDVTTYTYYANDDAEIGKRGSVATITDSAGHVTSITAYNAQGSPLTIIDPNGMTITLAYDARQRLSSRTMGTEVTSYDHDAAGQLVRVTLPDGSYLAYGYDAAHRLTSITDNAGDTISYTLDAMGNRRREEVHDPTNALVQMRSRVYSSINRLSQEIGAQNQVTQYTYDDQGNVLTVNDPLNHVTSKLYDSLNRLKQVTDPALGVTQYAYNGLDALTQVTDPRSLATSYTIDGLGNLTLQASPDSGNTTNTYDAGGNLLTRTDAKGQITTYAYDALNRVTLITFHDGSKQSYVYDQGANGIGRLSSITETDPAENVVRQIAYSYDLRGRVVSETRNVAGVQYVTSYTYDGNGCLVGVTYPGGRTLTYTLDALGRIAQIGTTVGGHSYAVVSSVAYHPFGGVKSFTLGNGQTYTRTYDQDGRIASYTMGSTSFAIGYDAASRIEFISDTGTPANSNSYGYDALDRLTSAVTPATPYSYSYDAVGNRLSKGAGAGTDTYTYDSSSNRIASITPASGPPRSFVFDANGSATNDGNNTYAYDVRGRMAQATSSIGTMTYEVNALGQRVRKTNNLGDTVFHYDTRGHLIAETDASGTLKREYLYLGDLPVAVSVH